MGDDEGPVIKLVRGGASPGEGLGAPQDAGLRVIPLAGRRQACIPQVLSAAVIPWGCHSLTAHLCTFASSVSEKPSLGAAHAEVVRPWDLGTAPIVSFWLPISENWGTLLKSVNFWLFGGKM